MQSRLIGRCFYNRVSQAQSLSEVKQMKYSYRKTRMDQRHVIRNFIPRKTIYKCFWQVISFPDKLSTRVLTGNQDYYQTESEHIQHKYPSYMGIHCPCKRSQLTDMPNMQYEISAKPEIGKDLPAMVKVTSGMLWSPSRIWSITKAESAKSIFFFLSKRLTERKFNLHQKKQIRYENPN